MLNYLYQMGLVAVAVAAAVVAVADYFGISVAVAVDSVADIDFLHVLNSN